MSAVAETTSKTPPHWEANVNFILLVRVLIPTLEGGNVVASAPEWLRLLFDYNSLVRSDLFWAVLMKVGSLAGWAVRFQRLEVSTPLIHC